MSVDEPGQGAAGQGDRMAQAAMTVEELERFLAAEFPQAFHDGSGLSIEEVWQGGGRVRQAYRAEFIRPGGTISGPTMMALADFAMYVGVLASIGPVPLAVTTNLNINFLRKPGSRDVIAECRLLKLGKRLAVGRGPNFLRRHGRAGRACDVDLLDPSEITQLIERLYNTIFITY
jgi:uncharacterized protein (TIGR00369 family)